MQRYSEERMSEALREANAVLAPLLGAAARARRLSALGAAVGGARLYSSSDKRVYLLLMDMPTGNPLLVALYVSTQRSRRVSPSQLARRLERLRRMAEGLRGRDYTAADIIYVYVSAGGRPATRGALQLAKRMHVAITRSGQEARRRIARYLARRYNRLIEKIASRKIWGRVALLAYTLSEAARRLLELEEPGAEQLLRAVEKGVEASTLPRLPT